ncbi:MAG: hypothetical protein M3Z95_08330, partial [Actinomycetota bacterium]|nr:hypothetical protein [Actinomycetota bacterium]
DIGFDVDANEVTILTAPAGARTDGGSQPPASDPDAARPDGGPPDERHVPRASKAQIAEEILDAVERLRASP